MKWNINNTSYNTRGKEKNLRHEVSCTIKEKIY